MSPASQSANRTARSLLERTLEFAQQGGSVKALADWLPKVMVKEFDLCGCQIELYDSEQRVATLIGGIGAGWLGAADQPHAVEPFWEIYEPLTLGKSLLFSSQDLGGEICSTTPLTWLGCPMMSRTELLGNVWLTRTSKEVFDELELGQLRQIIACCAIALHQGHLEQAVATQQTEIQQLRQAKDEFLQLISHELFVPLGNIQLSTQTLERIFKDVSWRKVPKRSTVLKILSLLTQECRRQKQFADNLITLMFPEYQKSSEPVLMNLSDWIPSLLRTFDVRIEQESLTLKTNLPKAPLLFECDITQLERILTELIANAIKYTPAKKTITMTVKATDTEVEIAIANTGVHIPIDHQPRIFEKFYRVPELDQRQYGGSGLGLALVKQLVTNLDGTVAVKSTKQKTTFTLKLPR